MKKNAINKINKCIILFFIFVLLVFNANIVLASALSLDTRLTIDDQTNALGYNAGFSETFTIAGMAANIITAFLSLLGIIFVSLMIYAGYHWMTAGGEEEKINKAKDTIRRAIIGLIIVMSAYAITRFVFTSLPESGSNSGSGYNTGSSN